VLCRPEIRRAEKTRADEEAQNVFYIVRGNDATPDELLRETGQRIIEIIVPSVI
jgi:DNA/RNA-binding domain of Phe-tRNA-synthetase-like protein